MKRIMILSFILLFTAVLFAQDKEVSEAEFKVFGNCGMCKSRIEKTLKIKGVKLAKWDKKTKMLKVAYIESEITLDSIKQKIAAVGHDTEEFKAPDSVYEKLPACCLYRSGENTH
jgi:copper chaperone CopZ